MKKISVIRAFIAAPIILLVGYLVSLPVYYFALTWKEGEFAFYIENGYIVAFGIAGFLGLKGFNRLFRDDGSGDVYLIGSLIAVMAILLVFQGRETYGVELAKLIYPDGLSYKSGLTFQSGLNRENITDLMKFSSIYICTYAASFCMLFAMFCRARCNECVPQYIAGARKYFGFSRERMEETASGTRETEEHIKPDEERGEEELLKDLRAQLYAELNGKPAEKEQAYANCFRRQRTGF